MFFGLGTLGVRVERITVKPARAVGEADECGANTLAPGGVGDIRNARTRCVLEVACFQRRQREHFLEGRHRDGRLRRRARRRAASELRQSKGRRARDRRRGVPHPDMCPVPPRVRTPDRAPYGPRTRPQRSNRFRGRWSGRPRPFRWVSARESAAHIRARGAETGGEDFVNLQDDLLKGEILILVTFNALINLVDRSFRAIDVEGLVAVQVGATIRSNPIKWST